MSALLHTYADDAMLLLRRYYSAITLIIDFLLLFSH